MDKIVSLLFSILRHTNIYLYCVIKLYLSSILCSKLPALCGRRLKGGRSVHGRATRRTKYFSTKKRASMQDCSNLVSK